VPLDLDIVLVAIPRIYRLCGGKKGGLDIVRGVGGAIATGAGARSP